MPKVTMVVSQGAKKTRHSVNLPDHAYAKDDPIATQIERAHKLGYNHLKDIAKKHGISIPSGDHSLHLEEEVEKSKLDKYQQTILEALRNVRS